MPSEKGLAEKPAIEVIAEIHNGAAYVIFKSPTGLYSTLAGRTRDKSKWVKVADAQEYIGTLKTRQRDCRVLFKSPDGEWHDFEDIAAFRSSKLNYICTGAFEPRFKEPEKTPALALV